MQEYYSHNAMRVRQQSWLWFFTFCFVFLASAASRFPSLDHLTSTTPANDQAQAARDVIERAIGLRVAEFHVAINSSIGPSFKDTFTLQTERDGTVCITGSSGVAAAWGFYYYLSQYCGCHISWAGDQLSLPTALPVLPPGGVTVTSNDRFSYYPNVNTQSYSFVWWTWSRWEREIDWMAMNGINLPVAFTGQEAIWQKVLLKMGFTQSELDNHFGGPAFLAWSRLGNMHGWAGPLPQNWHTQQVALQHQILDRMRSLGMVPILPAFAGYVPNAIRRIFPSANVTKMSNQIQFEEKYCCTLLLNVEDPLFAAFGKAFLDELLSEFGTDHVYSTDTFNEMKPPSSDPAYLRKAGQAVYHAMLASDPDAIWLMQGWLFETAESFWQPAQAEALLTSVPQGRMIVLDLICESRPQYIRLKSFYGQPFIWCMVNNFGGSLDMFGTLQTINLGPPAGRAFPNSTMIGIGLTLEGINQNNVIYEFMLENRWRQLPRNISNWISDYAVRRYGASNLDVDYAWQILKSGVYNCTTCEHYEAHGMQIFTMRPRFYSPIKPNVWYSTAEFFVAWDHFIIASKHCTKSQLFRYDLVDVTRQSLQLVSILFYQQVLEQYKAKDLEKFLYYSNELLNLFLDVEKLLSSDGHFLLGTWLESAKNLSTIEAERQHYEYNARNQITLWGPRGELLDYANRQWAGLMKAYYFPRWKLFIGQLQSQWNSTFDEQYFDKLVFRDVEEPFTFDRSAFTTKPTGDQIDVALEMHERYRLTTVKHSAFFRSIENQ